MMLKLRKFKKNPLFLVFVLPIIVDVIGTVLGQPQEYWESGYREFSEAVPFIYLLLQIHPWVFVFACLSIWLPFTYWLIKRLGEPMNIWATMSLLIGHGYNSVNWLRVDLYRAGWFSGQDQFSQAMSLVPMTAYILLAGWLAKEGLMGYLKTRKRLV